MADRTAARAASPPAEITGTSFVEIDFHLDTRTPLLVTKPDCPVQAHRRVSPESLTTPFIVDTNYLKVLPPESDLFGPQTNVPAHSPALLSCNELYGDGKSIKYQHGRHSGYRNHNGNAECPFGAYAQ